jgi:hypothetical protein
MLLLEDIVTRILTTDPQDVSKLVDYFHSSSVKTSLSHSGIDLAPAIDSLDLNTHGVGESDSAFRALVPPLFSNASVMVFFMGFSYIFIYSISQSSFLCFGVLDFYAKLSRFPVFLQARCCCCILKCSITILLSL